MNSSTSSPVNRTMLEKLMNEEIVECNIKCDDCIIKIYRRKLTYLHDYSCFMVAKQIKRIEDEIEEILIGKAQ